jgi:hypothetical protein
MVFTRVITLVSGWADKPSSLPAMLAIPPPERRKSVAGLNSRIVSLRKVVRLQATPGLFPECTKLTTMQNRNRTYSGAMPNTTER